ncbi:ABC transporter permease [Winogradskyella sp.]|uniref:ABC transporter permease n=1 Tax=Winogradskyella sp. TaxID=1883156 RepID=UPI00260E19AC|nr:ABC transporter permease [Winogradskyella sp.]
MIKNYFKIAVRSLKKNRIYSFINISGLAIGMAATMLIGLWIYDELNYNKDFKNHDKIAQVFQSQTFNGRTGSGPAIPLPLEPRLREDFGDNFEYLSLSSWTQTHYLEYGDKTIERSGNYIEPQGLEIFTPKIVKGEENPLKEIKSIMLSKSTAEAMFGNEEPLGKIIKVNNRDDMLVTAIFEDFPVNSRFNDVTWLIPWKHFVASREWVKNSLDNWGNNSFQLFVKIGDNVTMQGVSERIKNSKKDANEDTAEFNPVIFLLPMKDWHLRSNFEDGVQVGGRIENVWLFGIIGTFVLLLASINFMNLSTARSEKRAKEVGVRKAIGSSRKQLINQFLSESFVVVSLAFVITVGIVLLSLPGFNNLASKEISFPWSNVEFWLYSFLFILFVALLSGSYPALYLSSFKPVRVLKGTFKGGRFSALPRKILVVTQFTVSVALIIGTLVVMNQIQYAKDRPVGYTKEGLIQIPIRSQAFDGKADLMRDQFIVSGGAVEMATSMSPATDTWSNRSGFKWEGKPEDFQEDFAWTEVSYEFVKTLGMNIIMGRDFSRDFGTDSTAVIINKTAMEYMGLTDPIGKLIYDESIVSPEPPMKIIGVVDDVVIGSPYTPSKQQLYVFDRYGNISFYNLRLNPKNSVSENLSRIESIFKTYFPNLPFTYEFIDEEFAKKFAAEERIASLARVFTLLAILISCLGLFGLASFVAEQRTKEIGVRKVLGASISQLWLLLSKDFITLVIIALVIASPIAYYIMGGWLQKFPYRTMVSWDVFVIACSGALIITLITVSFQAIKAATTNPVKSLRTE